MKAMATIKIDDAMVHLAPNLSIRFPTTGDSVLLITPMLKAMLTCVRDQPNSLSRGSMKKPKVNCVVPKTAPIETAETPTAYQPL